MNSDAQVDLLCAVCFEKYLCILDVVVKSKMMRLVILEFCGAMQFRREDRTLIASLTTTDKQSEREFEISSISSTSIICMYSQNIPKIILQWSVSAMQE